MAKIYWITGLPNQGKTELGKRLYTLLQTERRNWRKSVFHIDEKDFPDLSHHSDITFEIQTISSYLVKSGCDVVVSSISPYLDEREFFKKEMKESLVEIFIDSSRPIKKDFEKNTYQNPESNYIHILGDGRSIEDCYNELINTLISENKV